MDEQSRSLDPHTYQVALEEVRRIAGGGGGAVTPEQGQSTRLEDMVYGGADEVSRISGSRDIPGCVGGSPEK